MLHQTADIMSRIENIARYLAHSFPTRGIDRYEDGSRDVIGFRFIGAPQGNVEFERTWLETLPMDENGIAHEMHLRHVCAEINETAPGQRVVFNAGGMRREAAQV
jgi:hypothetical protein